MNKILKVIFLSLLSLNLFSKTPLGPLMEAVQDNNLNLVKKIVSILDGSKVSSVEEYCMQEIPKAIEVAIRNNYKFRYLLDKETDPNFLKENRESLIDNYKIIDILLNKNNNINDEILTLSLNLFYLRDDNTILKLLIQNNAYIQIEEVALKEYTYSAPLLYCGIKNATYKTEKISKTEPIIKKQSLISWTIENNDINGTKALIRNNIIFSKKDFELALKKSLIKNNYEIVELLIQYGANVNGAFTKIEKSRESKKGYLYWAVEQNSYPLTKILLENGAISSIYNGFKIERSRHTKKLIFTPIEKDIYSLNISEDIKILLEEY